MSTSTRVNPRRLAFLREREFSMLRYIDNRMNRAMPVPRFFRTPNASLECRQNILGSRSARENTSLGKYDNYSWHENNDRRCESFMRIMGYDTRRPRPARPGGSRLRRENTTRSLDPGCPPKASVLLGPRCAGFRLHRPFRSGDGHQNGLSGQPD